MSKKILFLDGLMVPVGKTAIHNLSPGVLSGKGVFETMRVYNGKIFAVEKHLSRLARGLRCLKIRSPYGSSRIKKIICQSLASNKLKHARVRLTIWKDRQKVRMAVAVLPYHPFCAAKYREGFKAVISDIRRDEQAKAKRVKSINYLPFLLAWRKAKTKGNDEAILLNRRGFIVEGSRTNLFIIKKKVLFTPSLNNGCLDGITRAIVIKIAQKLKIKVRQTNIQPEDLYEADEAFMTNSLIEIMPLTYVQGKIIGKGERGPVTTKVQKAYKDIVKSCKV